MVDVFNVDRNQKILRLDDKMSFVDTLVLSHIVNNTVRATPASSIPIIKPEKNVCRVVVQIPPAVRL